MSSLLETAAGPVRIRPVGSSDAAAFRDLRLEALRRHPAAFAADHDHEAARPPASWAEWVERGAGGPRGVTYVAEAREGLVGMAGIYRTDTAKLRHAGTIWGVYVRPAWRRRRLGDALVTACVDWAGKQEMRVVTLAVIVDNAPAIACYARAGFTVYGIAPAVIHHDGVDHDELLMARRLPAGHASRRGSRGAACG